LQVQIDFLEREGSISALVTPGTKPGVAGPAEERATGSGLTGGSAERAVPYSPAMSLVELPAKTCEEQCPDDVWRMTAMMRER